MKIVGLTGGIATGKSTVSHFIQTSDIKLLDADKVAREVVEPGTASYHLILDTFGVSILNANSAIDRAALGAIIFSNAEQRALLNAITHPRIRTVLLKQVLEAFLLGHRMVVIDTPLLFEAGFYRWVHNTVLVYCPASVQKDRLMARDGISAADAKARMDSQMSIEQKRNLAQYMIDNAGSMASTKQQTANLMNELMPSYLTTFIMWSVMFWPALCFYVWINAYEKVDKIRHVGFLTYRPIPEIVKPQPLKTQDYGEAARAN